MTQREKSWLIAGFLMGAVVVAAIFIGRQHVVSTPEPTAAAAETASDTAGTLSDISSTPDSGSIELTDDEQTAIGIETVEIERQTIRKEITAPGKVAEPETGIGTISARIGGRIEKLLVNITGETVRRGQAIALIYSPEVFTAAEEYRLALENRQHLSSSKEPQAIDEADELVRASRRRLELWGISAEQIDMMASSAEKAIQITTYSPVSGIVTKRNVAEGQYVKEGDVLFELADLSTVWVQADVFESDIPLVHAGQSVKITAPTLGGGSVQGTVSFLQPSVDPQNRTMMARIQVRNPQMRLRPGMFVQVSLQAGLGNDVVAVPRSAVLETGKEKIVYVAKGNGVFEKRPIDASVAGDEYYAATSGIKPGERVVTHGNFLIDSQTKLTGTITGMFSGSKAFNGQSNSSQANTSKYTLAFQSEPTPATGGSEATFHVQVTGADGKSVSDAQVQVTLVMPAMPAMGMPEMRSVTNLTSNGAEYVGNATVPTAGAWNVTVEARRDGQLLGRYKTQLEAK